MKLAIAVVLLAGCWGSAAPPKPAPVVSPGSTTSVTDLVRVIASGSSPRKLLRYQLKANSVERIDLDLAMSTSTHMDDTMLGARDQHADVPTMRSRMRVDIGSIDAAGTTALGFVYEDCRIAPEAKVADAMRNMFDNILAKFVGMHGSAKLTTRGTTENLVFEAPAGADPMVVRSLDQMKDQMKNFYVALPAEPVGVGGEWEITQLNQLMGASLTTVLHYKLVAIQGNTVTCEVEISQSATNQKLEIGGMAGKLDRLKSIGRGRVAFALDHVVPAGSLAMDTDFQFSVGQDESAQTRAATKIHVDMAIRASK